MHQTVNYIEINAPFRFVFERTNDLETWPKLFTEYKSVNILERRNDFILFELEDVDGNRWTSQRLIDRENKRARAKRLHPLPPFCAMDIEWYYSDTADGKTRMVWIQRFEAAGDYPAKEIVEHLNKGSEKQLAVIKRRLEETYSAKRAGRRG